MSSIDPASCTVNEALGGRVRDSADRPFLRFVGGPAQTYAQVNASVLRLAAGLQGLGVTPRDRVVAMTRSRIEAIHLWLATNLIGSVDVAINFGYKGGPLVHAINQARPKVIVLEAAFLPFLAEVAHDLREASTIVIIGDAAASALPARFEVIAYDALAACADVPLLPVVTRADTASIIYTSGTTGPAKGVIMPHGHVMLIAERTARHCRLGPGDVWYSFHPLYHMAGKFMAVLGSLVAGGEVVIDAAFEPEKWVSRIREFGATISGGHGPMLEMIFAVPPSPEDSNHRVKTVCSAPFPRHIARDFEARFGVKGLEVWGMTEIGLPVWSDMDAPLREGSCGKVDDDWFEFAIVDPDTDAAVVPGASGEFVVRPKEPWTVMQGYDGMPEKTVEAWRNLWFHTGDIGYMDAGGHLYFVERTSDRIRRRAENISAYDIEIAAMKHPAVREAAAIGVPSEFAGDDDIELWVALHGGAEVAPLDLLKHLARALPHYMVPRYLRFLDALPRSATNKIQRALLKKAPRDPSIWDRKAHGVSLRDLIGPET